MPPCLTAKSLSVPVSQNSLAGEKIININRNTFSEILAPVSNLEMAMAAIHNGADAVYLGIPGFNARGRSEKLVFSEIETIMKKCRLYGLKVYWAFNILLFEDELQEAITLLLDFIKLRPDGVILQDIAAAVLLNKCIPDLPLHASTQMTITSTFDIGFLKPLALKRYTLARELTIKEIQQIRQTVKEELEVFIHGSLCIAYSGQCFTSAGFGGRSANRGECAQSCRHEYELYLDQDHKTKRLSVPGNFLVSPHDLLGGPLATLLMDMGINALKIEGRLKSPEYVAAAANYYVSLKKLSKNPATTKNMRLTFARGHSPGWLKGDHYKALVGARQNGHTGIYLGKVAGINENQKQLTIQLYTQEKDKITIERGDGIYITDYHLEAGGPVYDFRYEGGFLKIFLANDFKIPQNLLSKLLKKENRASVIDCYLSSSSSLNQSLHKSFSEKDLQKKIEVTIKVTVAVGKPLRITVSDGINTVTEQSEDLISEAINKPMNEPDIREAVGKLSDTVFEISRLDIQLGKNCFLPNKLIRHVRKTALEKLHNQREKLQTPYSLSPFANPPQLTAFLQESSRRNKKPANRENVPRLNILCREPEHIESLLKIPPHKWKNLDTLYLDFPYGHDTWEHYKILKEKTRGNGLKVALATPRVFKDSEKNQIEKLAELKPDAVLARSNGALEVLKNYDLNVIADFSLNITNHIAANYYLDRENIKKITASYDLIFDNGHDSDIKRLLMMAEKINPDNLEVALEYYLPSFYMEYCIYSRYLSNGEDYKSCGFVCKNTRLKLKDRLGVMHPVLADVNCRNTMYNGRRKSIFSYLPKLLQAGISSFRIELLLTDDPLLPLIDKFEKLACNG